LPGTSFIMALSQMPNGHPNATVNGGETVAGIDWIRIEKN
jgi:hypothetical protein